MVSIVVVVVYVFNAAIVVMVSIVVVVVYVFNAAIVVLVSVVVVYDAAIVMVSVVVFFAAIVAVVRSCWYFRLHTMFGSLNPIVEELDQYLVSSLLY